MINDSGDIGGFVWYLIEINIVLFCRFFKELRSFAAMEMKDSESVNYDWLTLSVTAGLRHWNI